MSDEIVRETINCPLNNLRISNLEEGMIGMKEDISTIKDQNSTQNQMLAQIKAVVDFMIEDKKEQREFNNKQLTALEEVAKTQIETQGVLKSLTTDVDKIMVWQKEADNKSKIDLIELFRDNIKYIIGLITVGGILYGISQIAPTLVK